MKPPLCPLLSLSQDTNRKPVDGYSAQTPDPSLWWKRNEQRLEERGRGLSDSAGSQKLRPTAWCMHGFARSYREITWPTSRLLPDKAMVSILSRIVSPTKGYVQALTPMPVNMTLSGDSLCRYH